MSDPLIVQPGTLTRGRGESHIPPSAYGRTPEGAPLYAALVTDKKPRCPGCGRFGAYVVTRPWRIKCSKCHRVFGAAPGDPFPYAEGQV